MPADVKRAVRNALREIGLSIPLTSTNWPSDMALKWYKPVLMMMCPDYCS